MRNQKSGAISPGCSIANSISISFSHSNLKLRTVPGIYPLFRILFLIMLMKSLVVSLVASLAAGYLVTPLGIAYPEISSNVVDGLRLYLALYVRVLRKRIRSPRLSLRLG